MILIKGGHVITSFDSFEGDILIGDGKIQYLGKHLEIIEPEAEVIDATGLYVIPGGIDPHVHMELPVGGGLYSADDFEAGTRAAVAGGTTSIIDFVTPEPGQSLIEALKIRKREAQNAICDYGLHMSITAWNDTIPAQMKQCVENEGITSFKVYMAYKKAIGLDDGDLFKVMDTAAKLGARVAIHCEHDEGIAYLQNKFIAAGKTSPKYHPLARPPQVELEAVSRALMMADFTKCPLYIVHVSTAPSVREIAAARFQGLDVAAETCPHYLLLDDSEYERTGFGTAAYVMSPPLRKKSIQASLWEALQRGALGVVATDHCPFNMKNGKDRGRDDFTKIPSGVAGVEDRMALLYTYGVLEEKITLNQWVELTSTTPAKLFGLYPRKGTILKNSDADIVLWEPACESTISAETHYSRCDTNIYEGFKLKGKTRMVITNGGVAFKDNTIKIKKGAGRYLRRQ
ncbi:MAG: dihydropyrimidinase [bacterium]|nr:dihydropyrimidinase [bacterium]